MTTIRERYSSGWPTGTTRAETVERPPPPCVGMQPRSGWNACRPPGDRHGVEERVARRRLPRLHRRTEPPVERDAHVSRRRLRIEAADDAASARAGEEIVGRAVRRHDHPWAGHADARRDAVTLVRRRPGRRECRGHGERRDEGEERGPHGILLNHSPESRPPASTNASPPPAAAALTSIVFLRVPVRDPSSS